jgi:hypothetical protein
MPLNDGPDAPITYACGHSLGWCVTNFDEEPRCVVCGAPIGASSESSASTLPLPPRPRLRLIRGGGEGDSGTTAA